MRTKSIALLSLIIFSFLSCNVNKTDLIDPENTQSNKLFKRPIPKFGIMSLNLPVGDPDRTRLIRQSGPNGSGWEGITVDIGPAHEEEMIAAKNAGYYPIIGVLYRPAIVDLNQWSFIESSIIFSNNYVDWFYVDDGLTAGGISKSRIDSVASLVHASSKLLAVSDVRRDIMELSSNEHWYDNVDIIMPYRYGNDLVTPKLESLRSFFEFVKTKYLYKDLVPILGYKAELWYDPANFHQPDQKGNLSGDEGYIEMAASYTTKNIIFYYHKWYTGGTNDPNMPQYFYNLTDYLQTYNYIPLFY